MKENAIGTARVLVSEFLLIFISILPSLSSADDSVQQVVPLAEIEIAPAAESSDCAVAHFAGHLIGVYSCENHLSYFTLPDEQPFKVRPFPQPSSAQPFSGGVIRLLKTRKDLFLFSGFSRYSLSIQRLDVEKLAWIAQQAPPVPQDTGAVLDVMATEDSVILLVANEAGDPFVTIRRADGAWTEARRLDVRGERRGEVVCASVITQSPAVVGMAYLLRPPSKGTPAVLTPYVLGYAEIELADFSLQTNITISTSIANSFVPGFPGEKIQFVGSDFIACASANLEAYRRDGQGSNGWTPSVVLANAGRTLSRLVYPERLSGRIAMIDRRREYVPLVSRTPLALLRLDARQTWLNNDVLVCTPERDEAGLLALTDLYSFTYRAAITESDRFLYVCAVGRKKVGLTFDQFKEDVKVLLRVFERSKL